MDTVTTAEQTVEQNFSKIDQHYNELYTKGKLVHVKYSMWGMHAKLNEADVKSALGSEDAAALPDIFALGKIRLVPKRVFNKFKSLEAFGRRVLQTGSFDFPIAEAHFVPRSKYSAVVQELDKAKELYDREVITFIQNYDIYKQEMLVKYSTFREILEPKYPSVETILHKFGCHISKDFEISFPNKVERPSLEELTLRKEKIETWELQMQMEYNRRHRQVSTFLDNVEENLYGKIQEACQHIMTRIKEGQTLTKGSLNAYKNAIQDFREMNFLDDKRMYAELDIAEKLATGEFDFKTDKEAVHRLADSVQSVMVRAIGISTESEEKKTKFRRVTL